MLLNQPAYQLLPDVWLQLAEMHLLSIFKPSNSACKACIKPSLLQHARHIPPPASAACVPGTGHKAFTPVLLLHQANAHEPNSSITYLLQHAWHVRHQNLQRVCLELS
jgi:hypothetical protein